MKEKKILPTQLLKLLLWKYIPFCRPHNFKLKGKLIFNRYAVLVIDNDTIITIQGDLELSSTTLLLTNTKLDCGKLVLNNSHITCNNSTIELGNFAHVEQAQISFTKVQFYAEEQCRIHNLTITALDSNFVMGSYFLAQNMRKDAVTWNFTNAQFKAGNNCRLQCNIYQHQSKLNLGNNIFINAGTNISCIEQIDIGDYVMISYDCLLFDNNSHALDFELRRAEIDRGFPNATNQAAAERPKSSAIRIENDAWIGTRCIILKGVHIGQRAVAAANTSIAKNVDADTLVYSNATNYVSINKNS